MTDSGMNIITITDDVGATDRAALLMETGGFRMDLAGEFEGVVELEGASFALAGAVALEEAEKASGEPGAGFTHKVEMSHQGGSDLGVLYFNEGDGTWKFIGDDDFLANLNEGESAEMYFAVTATKETQGSDKMGGSKLASVQSAVEIFTIRFVGAGPELQDITAPADIADTEAPLEDEAYQSDESLRTRSGTFAVTDSAENLRFSVAGAGEHADYDLASGKSSHKVEHGDGTLYFSETTGEWAFVAKAESIDSLSAGERAVIHFEVTAHKDGEDSAPKVLAITLTGADEPAVPAPTPAVPSETAFIEADAKATLTLHGVEFTVNEAGAEGNNIWFDIRTADGASGIRLREVAARPSQGVEKQDRYEITLNRGELISQDELIRLWNSDTGRSGRISTKKVETLGDAAPHSIAGTSALQFSGGGNDKSVTFTVVPQPGLITFDDLHANGILHITDAEGVQSVTHSAAVYGTFTFDKSTGAWFYALDPRDADTFDLPDAPVQETITFTVTDNEGMTATHDLVIRINDDHATAVSLTDAVASVLENTTDMKVADITLTDADGGEPGTLQLTGADAGLFEIRDGAEGKELWIRADADINFEAPTTSLSVRVYLTEDASIGADFSATVDNVLEGIRFTSPATVAIDENTAFTADQTIYQSVVVEESGTPVQGGADYSIKPGGDSDLFSIHANTGAVAFAEARTLNFEQKSSYTFTVVFNRIEHEVTLSVTDLDEDVTFTSGDTATTLQDGAEVNHFIQIVYAARAEGGAAGSTITYTLRASGDSDLFRIDNDGNVFFRTTTTPDFASKHEYNFAVIASDGNGRLAEQEITLPVQGDYIPATGIAFANVVTSLDHAAAAEKSVRVANIEITDPDGGRFGVLELAGADADKFEITDGLLGIRLRLKMGADVTANETLAVRVQLAGNANIGADFSLMITDYTLVDTAARDTFTTPLVGDFNTSVSDADADTLTYRVAYAAASSTPATPLTDDEKRVGEPGYGFTHKVAGTYGVLYYNAGSGAWEYDVDADAVNALDAGADEADRFDVIANDGQVNFYPSPIIITFAGANDTPFLGRFTATITDTPATDTFSRPVTSDLNYIARDAEGDTLTFSVVHSAARSTPAEALTDDEKRAGEAGAGFTHKVAGTYGVLYYNDGSWAWKFVVDADAVNALNTGDTETDKFVVTANDGQADSNEGSLNIIFIGANETPVLMAIDSHTLADTTAIDTFTTPLMGDFSTSVSEADRDRVNFSVSRAAALGDGEKASGQPGEGFTHKVAGKYGVLYYNAGSGAWEYDVDADAVNGLPANSRTSDRFSVTARDDVSASVRSDPQTLTIHVTGANDRPIAMAQPVIVEEGTTYTFKAADFGFMDADKGNSLISVSILTVRGPGTLVLGKTVLKGDNVRLAGQNIAADDIGKLVYRPGDTLTENDTATFSYAVSDGRVNSVYTTMTITIRADDDTATEIALNPAISSIDENTAITEPRKVADITITDPDGGASGTLQLAGTHADMFEISGTELRLKAGVTLDHETAEMLMVRVQVMGDPSVGADYTLAINDLRETPTLAAITRTVADTPANNTFADLTGTFTAADADADAVTYNVTRASPNTSETGFTHSVSGTYGMLFYNETSGAWKFMVDAAAVNGLAAGASGMATFAVTATDNTDPPLTSAPQTLTITFTGSNEAPTATPPNVLVVNEDERVAITLAHLGFADSDGGTLQSITITGLPGKGNLYDNKRAAFFDAITAPPATITRTAIENGDLVFAPANNLRENVDRPLKFTASDGTNDSATATLTIRILADDDYATVAFTNKTASIVENTAITAPRKVADITFTDRDRGANVGTPELVAGTHTALFELRGDNTNGWELWLKANANGFDHETTPTLSVRVQNAGDRTIGKEYTLTIDNADEPAVFTSPATAPAIDEGVEVAADAAVYTAQASDPEGAAITYSLKAGGDAALFDIDPTTGAVTFKAATTPDFAGKPFYGFTVLASTGGGAAAEHAVTLPVTRDNPTVFAETGGISRIIYGIEFTLNDPDDARDGITLELVAIGTFSHTVSTLDERYIFDLQNKEVVTNTIIKEGKPVTTTKLVPVSITQTEMVELWNEDADRKAKITATIVEAMAAIETGALAEQYGDGTSKAISVLDKSVKLANAGDISDARNDLFASGRLAISDADGVQSVAHNGADATYGTFTFDETTGVWEYTLDPTRLGATTLPARETITFTVIDNLNREDTYNLVIAINSSTSATRIALQNIATSSIDEGMANPDGIKVGDIVITDTSGLPTATLRLMGRDADRFEIRDKAGGGKELWIRAGLVFDHEVRETLQVRIQLAEDNDVGLDHTLTVNDLNEAPRLATITNTDGATELTVADTAAHESPNDFTDPSGTFTATDVDDGDSVTYRVAGGAPNTGFAGFTHSVSGTYGALFYHEDTGAWRFVIDGFKVNALPAGPVKTDTFMVTAMDDNTPVPAVSAPRALTITFTGANDVPVLGAIATPAIVADTSANPEAPNAFADLTGTFTATDADADDADDSLTFRVAGTADAATLMAAEMASGAVGEGFTHKVTSSDYGVLYYHDGSAAAGTRGAWKFVVDAEAVNALAGGARERDIFAVTATDDGGAASAPLPLIIRFTGIDDLATGIVFNNPVRVLTENPIGFAKRVANIAFLRDPDGGSPGTPELTGTLANISFTKPTASSVKLIATAANIGADGNAITIALQKDAALPADDPNTDAHENIAFDVSGSDIIVRYSTLGATLEDVVAAAGQDTAVANLITFSHPSNVGRASMFEAAQTSLTGGVDTATVIAKFEIAGGELRLKAGAELNHEATPQIKLRVQLAENNAVYAEYTLTVEDADDPPTSTPQGITLAQPGDSHTFTVADFGFMDEDVGSALHSIRIANPPPSGAGMLALDGVAVIAGQVITRADIEANKFAYTSVVGAPSKFDFAYAVSDGMSNSEIAFMPVMVMGGNMPPQANFDTDIFFNSGEALPLTRRELEAIDRDTPDTDLTYKLTAITGGMLERVREDSPGTWDTIEVTATFTQDEVNRGLIRLNPTDDGSFTLVLSDGANPPIQPETITFQARVVENPRGVEVGGADLDLTILGLIIGSRDEAAIARFITSGLGNTAIKPGTGDDDVDPGLGDDDVDLGAGGKDSVLYRFATDDDGNTIAWGGGDDITGFTPGEDRVRFDEIGGDGTGSFLDGLNKGFVAVLDFAYTGGEGGDRTSLDSYNVAGIEIHFSQALVLPGGVLGGSILSVEFDAASVKRWPDFRDTWLPDGAFNTNSLLFNNNAAGKAALMRILGLYDADVADPRSVAVGDDGDNIIGLANISEDYSEWVVYGGGGDDTITLKEGRGSGEEEIVYRLAVDDADGSITPADGSDTISGFTLGADKLTFVDTAGTPADIDALLGGLTEATFAVNADGDYTGMSLTLGRDSDGHDATLEITFAEVLRASALASRLEGDTTLAEFFGGVPSPSSTATVATTEREHIADLFGVEVDITPGVPTDIDGDGRLSVSDTLPPELL